MDWGRGIDDRLGIDGRQAWVLYGVRRKLFSTMVFSHFLGHVHLYVVCRFQTEHSTTRDILGIRRTCSTKSLDSKPQLMPKPSNSSQPKCVAMLQTIKESQPKLNHHCTQATQPCIIYNCFR